MILIILSSLRRNMRTYAILNISYYNSHFLRTMLIPIYVSAVRTRFFFKKELDMKYQVKYQIWIISFRLPKVEGILLSEFTKNTTLYSTEKYH